MLCHHCKKEFTPKKHNQKYCAIKCKNLNLLATVCALKKKLAKMAMQVARGRSYYHLSKSLTPMERRVIKKKVGYYLYSKQFRSKI